MRTETRAALHPIWRRYGRKVWTHQDVVDVLPHAQMADLRAEGMIVRLSRSTPRGDPARWRLSDRGVVVAQIPSIREGDGRLRPLSCDERVALAAWRVAAVQARVGAKGLSYDSEGSIESYKIGVGSIW